MKKTITTAILLMALAMAAMAQQRMTREFVGSFQVDTLWYHPTSDSTVEVVPCQDGNCIPPPRVTRVPAQVSNDGNIYTVTRIGREAFYGHAVTVVLPETVLELAEDCMWGSYIDSVRLPNSVKILERNSISGTYPNLYIPASVEHIAPMAFENALIAQFTVDTASTHYCSIDGLLYSADTTELIAVPRNYSGVGGALVLPATVRRIGAYALQKVSSQLASLTLPEGLREIGVGGLGNYSWAVELPASVVRIEGNPVTKRPAAPFSLTVHPGNSHYRVDDGQLMSMDGDTLLLAQLPSWQTSYAVPEGVKVLGGELFARWGRSLDSVSLPEGLEVIGDLAFNETRFGINIPSTVRSIKYAAFAHSEIRGALELPALRELAPYAFSACNKVSSLVLPDSLEVIEYRAFIQCSNLERVTFGNCLREIHPEAFSGNRLTTLKLPRSVRTIGCNGISGSCQYIEFEGTPEALGTYATLATSIRFGEGNPPTLYADALPNVDTVYVPCGMAETYRRAVLDGWGDRFTYLEDCDGIEDAEESGLTLTLQGRDLRIDGTAGQPVRVLDAVGRTLFSGSAPATVRLPASGLYLVHSPGKKAVKVAAIH